VLRGYDDIDKKSIASWLLGVRRSVREIPPTKGFAPMKSELLSSTAPPIELIPLPHAPRRLLEIVEPGQTIPSARRMYHLICAASLPMIIFEHGRWKVPEPELPALATALGLRLKRSGRPRAASRRSAA
jgi:hypothetical protein